MKIKKIKTILFNPVHPVQKLAATLLLGAALGLSFSGARAAITTTGNGIMSDNNDIYASNPSHPADHSHDPAAKNYVGFSYFEYRQTNPSAKLTITTSSPNGHDGGAFYLVGGGTLATIGNITFANCAAGVLPDNNVGKDGGAIYFNGSGLVTHTGGGTLAFNGNRGENGGSIYARNALTMTGNYDALVFSANKADTIAGAISAGSIEINCLVSGLLNISDNSDGSTPYDGGGAFRADGGIVLSGSYGGILIASNTAGGSSHSYDNGGTFASFSGDIILSATVRNNLNLTGNYAYGSGGVFEADNIKLDNRVGGTLNISNNYSDYGSGALKTSGTLTVSGSYGAILIASNTGVGGASYAGGRLFFTTTTAGDLSIRDNAGSNSHGGAFWAGGNIEINNRVGGNLNISGNRVNGAGGAFYTSGGNINMHNLVNGTLNISGNNATDGDGGVFYAYSRDGVLLSLTGSYGAIVISSNTASGAGGVFYTKGGAGGYGDMTFSTTTAGNLSLNNNTGKGDFGGVLSVERNLTLHNLVGGTLSISGNRTLAVARVVGGGGAVNVGGTLALTGSYNAVVIASNTTPNYGGAFYGRPINLSATVANNLRVENNIAERGGAFSADGAININSRVGGTLSFSDNVATTTYGGALFADSSSLALGGSYGAVVISSNTAAREGGAFNAGGSITITATAANGITIINNVSGERGGAFAIYNGVFNLSLAQNNTLTASGNKSNNANGGFLSINSGTMIFNTASGALAQIGNALSVSNTTDSISAGSSVSLYKLGAGTLQLWANNTYQGNTYVSAGTLDLRGVLASKRVEVSNGATLKGSGTVSNSVTILSGGTIAPGDGPGVFTTSSLALGNGAALSLNLAAATPSHTRAANNSLLVVNGNLTVSGTAQIDVTLTASPVSGAVYDLVKYSGVGAGSVALRKLSGSGTAGTKAGDFGLVTSESGWIKLSYSGTTINTGTGTTTTTLTVTPASHSAAATASALSVSVTSNVAWTVSSSAAWLTPSSSSGSNNGTLSINIAANTGASRTGTLTISGGGITRTVAVTQVAAGTQPPPVTETWDLAGLTSKGLKLSAAKTLVVPKGTKLLKGTKAIYTWKRDGVTVLSGSGKNFTAKDSGTYTLTLSYTTADGQQHSQTQTFGKLKLFAQPKTATLTMTQTTDTITNSALRATSVVSGETLKLTASVGTVGGGAVGPFRYVWYCGSAVVRTQQSSATSDTFTTPAYGDKAVGYKCVVELVAKDAKNKPLGTAKSKDLKAKIILPPSAVTLSASAATVKENGTLTLSATAKGTAALTFTWYKNGAQIATGSAKKFAKKPVTVSDAGVYYVVVSQDKTTRRAQSASVVVNIQRADGSIVSGATQRAAAPMSAATSPAADQRRRDAAATLSDSTAANNSASASVLNLAPLKLSAGDVLTLSGTTPREYLILSETQHSTGAYHYKWQDNLTAEFQDVDAEAQLTLRFITLEGGVYELTVSGSISETGVFELRKK